MCILCVTSFKYVYIYVTVYIYVYVYYVIYFCKSNLVSITSPRICRNNEAKMHSLGSIASEVDVHLYTHTLNNDKLTNVFCTTWGQTRIDYRRSGYIAFHCITLTLLFFKWCHVTKLLVTSTSDTTHDTVSTTTIWVFPKIGVSQNGWFIMVPNPIKMDDLGGFPPIFGLTPIYYSLL